MVVKEKINLGGKTVTAGPHPVRIVCNSFYTNTYSTQTAACEIQRPWGSINSATIKRRIILDTSIPLLSGNQTQSSYPAIICSYIAFHQIAICDNRDVAAAQSQSMPCLLFRNISTDSARP